jgi:hypothetical protein
MMNKRAIVLTILVLISAMMLAPAAAMAQPLSGPPADQQFKYSTPVPPGVAAPEKESVE